MCISYSQGFFSYGLKQIHTVHKTATEGEADKDTQRQIGKKKHKGKQAKQTHRLIDKPKNR